MSRTFFLESSDEETDEKVYSTISETIESVVNGSASVVPLIVENVQKERDEKAWSDEERQRLVDAVKIFGVKDVERLKEAVGTRSVFDVLQYIHHMTSVWKTDDLVIPTPHDELSKAKRNRRPGIKGLEQNYAVMVDDSAALSDGGAPCVITSGPVYGGGGVGTLRQVASGSTSDGRISLANLRSTVEQFASNSPDSKLMEWQQLVKFALGNRRDYSEEMAKRLLHRKALKEDLKARQSARAANDSVDFGRIYRYFIDVVDGSRKTVLSPKDDAIVKYLIKDLGRCVHNVSNGQEKQKYFADILSAYRLDTLSIESIPTPVDASLMEDVLCSLNPLCMPSDFLSDDHVLLPPTDMEDEGNDVELSNDQLTLPETMYESMNLS